MIDSHLHAILDTAVDGIILMDAKGKVIMFNRACERIFGYAPAEVVGANVKRLMPKPYQEEHDQYLTNYQRTRERKIIGIGRQVVGQRKSGETFPLDLSVGEVTDGDEVAYVGILRDVSERVRAEEQRERLIEQLAKSISEQTHFVHAASHDLREPIRMIAAYCGRLEKDFSEELDVRGAKYLSIAISASQHMNQLLDDLVEFSRASQSAEQVSRFNANLVVDKVVDGLTVAIQNSRAEITHGDLPFVTANTMRFERLMHNLIGNALKYVAADAPPRVRIEAAREGAFWRFSVADNGIGIDPRFFERIFEPFKRLHSRGRYEGTGLGLTICRKIVEGFGGAISVRSSEGQGSTFSFTIPADSEADEGGDHDA